MASSSNGNQKSLKQRLTGEIMMQYHKDLLFQDVLEQQCESLDEGIKKRDEITKQLQLLPESSVRDLVVLFMINEDATDLQKRASIGKILHKLRCSMKLKMDFITSYN